MSEQNFWFKRQNEGIPFYPCALNGWISGIFYLLFISMPPAVILIYGVKIDSLVFFLLSGHVGLFTTLFVGLCFLYSEPIKK